MSGDRSSFVVFRVGSLELGVPAHEVVELARLGALTPVPLAPSHIRGVLAHGGRALPVVRLDTLCGLPASRGDDDLRLVVVSAGGMTVGLEAHRLLGVVEVADADLRPVEVTASPGLRQLATGELHRATGVVVLLDVATLVEAARPRDRA